MSTNGKTKKGWGVRVEIQSLKDGAVSPDVWMELPALMAQNIRAISEAPEVEYVEVLSGMKYIASFAPRDTEALAILIQGRYPSLALVLRERKDTKLAEELRALLTPTKQE